MSVTKCGAVCILSCLVLVSTVCSSALGGNARRTPDLLEEIASGDLAKCEAATNALAGQRRELLEHVRELARDGHEPNTRAAAMYLLGEWRASEACKALVKAITFSASPHPFWSKKPPREVALYGAYPAKDALIRIGLPSMPFLLSGIADSDDREVRDLCRIAIFEILRDVGGTGEVAGLRFVRQLLEETIRAQKEELARERLRSQLAIIVNQLQARTQPEVEGR